MNITKSYKNLISLLKYYSIVLCVIIFMLTESLYMLCAPDIPYFKPPDGYIAWNCEFFIGTYLSFFILFLWVFFKSGRSDEKIFSLSALVFCPIMIIYNICLIKTSFPTYLEFLNSKKTTLILAISIWVLVYLSNELYHGYIVSFFKKKRNGKRI